MTDDPFCMNFSRSNLLRVSSPSSCRTCSLVHWHFSSMSSPQRYTWYSACHPAKAVILEKGKIVHNSTRAGTTYATLVVGGGGRPRTPETLT